MTMNKVFRFLIFLLFAHRTCIAMQEDRPRIKTKLGVMVGTARVSETGKNMYSFEGIPYIEPPVGNLRFRAPEPKKPWAGELDATNCSSMCMSIRKGNVVGSEDCVVLNVHTPWDFSKGSPEKPLPVMVNIHGGAFMLGSGCAFFVGYSDYLLEHDVIVVTISYRVGVMGFLSTEDEEAPGNYGLLDQVESLKWVRDNIAAFGGNPNQVTIFGNSAGSASVHYLILSPHSKGLFHYAIGQSGASLCPWASTQRSKEPAQELARRVGCPHSPSSKMMDCLRSIDGQILVETNVSEESKRHGNLPFIWAPRVDSESTNPFLPRHPVDLMKTGDYNKVPMLIGHTSLEAGAYLSYPAQFPGPTVSEMGDKWDNSCKVSMAFRENFIPEDKGTEWCSTIKRHYIEADKSFEDSELDYATFLGDAWFVSPVYKATELLSKHGDVYFYVFNYDNKRHRYFNVLLGFDRKIDGVAHADELLYLFKYPEVDWDQGSPEYKMVEIITKIWTDFAKTGVPPMPLSGEFWPKVSFPNHKYVLMDANLSIEEDYRREDMELMNNIYEKVLHESSSKSKDEL